MEHSRHSGRKFACDAIHHLAAALALSIATVCAHSAHASEAITVTPLTQLPGGNGNWGVSCVSGNGLWLAGGCNDGVWGRACLWNAEGFPTTIGDLPGYPQSGGNGISYFGTVIVGSASPVGSNGSDVRAFRWSSESGMIDIGNLNGATRNGAYATNFDGSTVVGFSGDRAFRWTASSGMTDLGLPADALNRSAISVSGDGNTVVGFSSQRDFWGVYYIPFVWTPSEGARNLAALPDCREGYPSAVNRDGTVIVGQSYEWNTGRRGHAAKWTPAGVQDLGALGTGWYSYASHVSANGQVILGGSGPQNEPNTFPTPWIWTPATGMQRLADYLVSKGANLSGIPQPMWISGMSADGSTIALSGGNAGSMSFLISSIPVPQDSDGDGILDEQDNCPAIANPTQADCNSNGIGDVCEIAAGAPDLNADTIPDTCQCLADLFVDHQVNGADLGALLSQWGPANASTVSDMNRDGQVNGADLGYLLNAWGPCTN